MTQRDGREDRSRPPLTMLIPLKLSMADDNLITRAEPRNQRGTTMTAKPKTRKPPAAETGINPKLIELAVKL
jgi:hypothetical protein